MPFVSGSSTNSFQNFRTIKFDFQLFFILMGTADTLTLQFPISVPTTKLFKYFFSQHHIFQSCDFALFKPLIRLRKTRVNKWTSQYPPNLVSAKNMAHLLNDGNICHWSIEQAKMILGLVTKETSSCGVALPFLLVKEISVLRTSILRTSDCDSSEDDREYKDKNKLMVQITRSQTFSHWIVRLDLLDLLIIETFQSWKKKYLGSITGLDELDNIQKINYGLWKRCNRRNFGTKNSKWIARSCKTNTDSLL